MATDDFLTFTKKDLSGELERAFTFISFSVCRFLRRVSTLQNCKHCSGSKGTPDKTLLIMASKNIIKIETLL